MTTCGFGRNSQAFCGAGRSAHAVGWKSSPNIEPATLVLPPYVGRGATATPTLPTEPDTKGGATATAAEHTTLHTRGDANAQAAGMAAPRTEDTAKDARLQRRRHPSNRHNINIGQRWQQGACLLRGVQPAASGSRRSRHRRLAPPKSPAWHNRARTETTEGRWASTVGGHATYPS